jgi:transposase
MGGADMDNPTRWVGLDVHLRETAVAVIDTATGELTERRIAGGSAELVSYLQGLPRPWRGVYEAGPTGYSLARRAAEAGLEVAVCTPGGVARRPHERVKTDARDARRLARLLAAGQLTLVGVPALADEQLRDLVRAREDLRGDLMRARHRIGKFLMRREIRYPGPRGAWTLAHLDWLAALRPGDAASEITLADYLHAHQVLAARRGQLDAALGELAGASRFGPAIGRLRCLRGVETLTALGLCVEAGGFERFAHPEQLACYFGLVPSENSSGERRAQGAITKAGSGHARRLLVEAAWHYRRPPRVSSTLARRQAGQSAFAVDCAWRAQRRLHRRWQHLQQARGLRGGVVAVAVARELAHFCWELALGE